MRLEFKTLPKPIEINEPVKAKFTEYHVYSDIVLDFANTVRVSVVTSKLTPDTFVLREIIQNAVDSEILKTISGKTQELGDFLWTYKKVKVEDVGKWKRIENSGTLTEDIFLFGYSTKNKAEGEISIKPCRLVGRFGVGLKESIILMLQCVKHIVMIFGGHIYGFGYLYKDKLYYDIDWATAMNEGSEINPVIFRGEYNVTDKVIVYVPTTTESVLEIRYPFDKPYHVESGDRGMVYHNGVFSGYWDIPLDLNVCYVYADQYRMHAFMHKDFVKAIDMIADTGMKYAFIDVLKRYKKSEGKVTTLSVPDDLVFLFNFAPANLHSILQDALNLVVEGMVKEMNEKVVIIDRIKNVSSKELVAIGLPDIDDRYVEDLKSYLRDKGYIVLSYAEAIGGKLVEIYEHITEPTISDDINALIKLGKWLYQIGFVIMRVNNIPGWTDREVNGIKRYVDPYILDSDIADIPVKIVKHEYNGMLSDAVGVMLKLEDKMLVVLRHLPDEEKWMYPGVVIHELNHVFTNYEHGTYEWENIYNALYMVDAFVSSLRPLVTNLINLAIHRPDLFLQVINMSSLPNAVLPIELIEKGECRGEVSENEVKCNPHSPYRLKLVNRDGELVIEEEVVEEPS